MWTVRCSSVGNNVVFGFSKLFRGDICLCLLSAINLLSGMSLLSRYKPESCPALFCLIKSAALVEHMTDSCLVQLEQMTSLTCGISYCSYFTPSPHFSTPSLCLFLLLIPVTFLSSFLYPCLVWSSLFMLRVYITFGVLVAWLWAGNYLPPFKHSIQRLPFTCSLVKMASNHTKCQWKNPFK